jgi:hypothetical protein
MKKIREQIDYGNRPERMDPRLERGLADPESLYAKSPALRKGAKDVERLVSSRFTKVAEKLSSVTGIEDLSSKQVQGMIFREQMSKVPNIVSIETRHKDELEQLAIEACLEEAETSEEFFQIEAYLNREPIDVSNFRYQPEKEEKEKEETPQIPSFELEDLSKEEQIELEKHKRNIINAIIQGSAKKAHYLFQKPDVKARLDRIDPTLYRDYLGIMAINDFMYFTMDEMIENMSRTGNGVAGKVELSNAGEDEEEGDEGEETPDTIIKAYGLLFPILCHEIIKGIEEAKARHGLPEDPEIRQKVLGNVDLLMNEPMQLRIGPEIVEKIRFALPNEMFEPENKGLINWFHMLLYKIPAEDFLKLIGDAISDDSSKVKRAENEFKGIMREAMEMKEEYESSAPERPAKPKDTKSQTNDTDDEDEDDVDLSGFFDDLGIS